MNKYEEKAKRIMERGDIILEKKKKRIIKISRITGAVTGLCAVFAIGFGIWNNTILKESAKPPVINESSIIIPVTEVSTEENTAYNESDAQTSSENQKPEINVTTEKITNEKTTMPAVSVTPTVSHTSPVNTNVYTKQTSAATDKTNVTTVNNSSSADADSTTASQKKTTAVTKPTTSLQTVQTTIVTESSVQTTTDDEWAPPGGSNDTDSSPEPTNPPAGAMPPPRDFVFGDDQIKYILSWDHVAEELIGEYLGTIPGEYDVYSIADIPIEEAVALKRFGTYYIYYNKTNTPKKRSDLYVEKIS